MSTVADPRYLTTLARIRAHSLRADSWAILLRNLGKTQADDEPLHLLTVLDSNGLDDALWCLRACDGIDRECRLLAVRFARQVQHLLTDPRHASTTDHMTSTPKVSPWSYQEGRASHYTTLAIQPFQYSMANNLDPMQHTVIKYVTRFRDKGGIEDLLKARHTLDLLIDWETKRSGAKPC